MPLTAQIDPITTINRLTEVTTSQLILIAVIMSCATILALMGMFIWQRRDRRKSNTETKDAITNELKENRDDLQAVIRSFTIVAENLGKSQEQNVENSKAYSLIAQEMIGLQREGSNMAKQMVAAMTGIGNIGQVVPRINEAFEVSAKLQKESFDNINTRLDDHNKQYEEIRTTLLTINQRVGKIEDNLKTNHDLPPETKALLQEVAVKLEIVSKKTDTGELKVPPDISDKTAA